MPAMTTTGTKGPSRAACDDAWAHGEMIRTQLALAMSGLSASGWKALLGRVGWWAGRAESLDEARRALGDARLIALDWERQLRSLGIEPASEIVFDQTFFDELCAEIDDARVGRGNRERLAAAEAEVARLLERIEQVKAGVI